jgi:hypothetical protein
VVARSLKEEVKRPSDNYSFECEMIKETIRGLVALEDQKV